MTFTYTLEELHNRANRREMLRGKVKRKIVEALLQERISRKLKLEEVSQATKIPLQKIESLELGKCRLNWTFIAILLKYYGKSFQISLKDMPKEKQ